MTFEILREVGSNRLVPARWLHRVVTSAVALYLVQTSEKLFIDEEDEPDEPDEGEGEESTTNVLMRQYPIPDRPWTFLDDDEQDESDDDAEPVCRGPEWYRTMYDYWAPYALYDGGDTGSFGTGTGGQVQVQDQVPTTLQAVEYMGVHGK